MIRAIGIEKAWADRAILRGADLSVDPGERIGLVGPNGCGKSTLLRILAGIESDDGGRVVRDGRVAVLRQEPVLEGATVGEAVSVALAWHRQLLADYDAALAGDRIDDAASIQARLDDVGWELDHRIDEVLSRLSAPSREASTARLSGGERRRVALARVLLERPDVLLLDEPTNHLDADTVDWLQAWLQGFRGAVLLVTHDRYLLEAVATRIVEVEDGICVSYDGSYTDYLLARAERRASQEKAEDRRLSMIAREAAWAARSPAARTTKQRGRLKRLEDLRSQRRLARQDSFSLDLRIGLRHGGTLLECHDVRKGFGDRVLIAGLDFTVRPGERLGILGPNGIGKSTLLRLIQGQLEADRGTIELGKRVRVAVLDQERTGLNAGDTVLEAAGGGAPQVKVGEQWVQVQSFLGRFLFRHDHFDQKVEALSGGERARLLLAKLLLEGCALILLDEPTNDLDLMTLRVLEEALLGFDGAAIVVTHDRAFLDRVCTGVLAFEGGGVVTTYADRLQAKRAADARRATAAPKKKKSKKAAVYTNKKQIEAVQLRIEELETAVAETEEALADPSVWKTDAGATLTAKLQQLEADVAAAYEEWESLDA